MDSCVTMKFSTTSVSWTTRIGPRGRLCGLSFVRIIWIKMPAKAGPEPAHTLPKSHSHEVQPGEPLLTERQKWTRDNFDFRCGSWLIIQTADCAHGTVPGYFSSRVNL